MSWPSRNRRSVRAGFGADSRVHAGDGAPWIVGQGEEQFGAQGSYLIDLYHHVCVYLSDAAKAIASRGTPSEGLDGARAEDGASPKVDEDQALTSLFERSSKPAELLRWPGICRSAPERSKAHRYIAQQRLKRPGAWWRVKHAEYMLALRVTRRNGDWDAYWASIGKSGSPRMAQISTDQPYHENPQRDCITLDRTPPGPNELCRGRPFPHRGLWDKSPIRKFKKDCKAFGA